MVTNTLCVAFPRWPPSRQTIVHLKCCLIWSSTVQHQSERTLAKKQITANYGAHHLLQGLSVCRFTHKLLKESLSHGTVPRLHCSLATPQDTNMGKSATTFHSRGSTLRPFPRVLLCPLKISKSRWCIGCSLNLNISCSSAFWEYGQRPFQYGQAIDPLNLPLSGHPPLTKARAE